jgi:Zn-dependent peptidase ImmA (M78 family)
VLPFVFVNGARPVVLQRFALERERAHLALGHREAYDARIDWSRRSGREVSANAFAEELAAPAAAVRRWLEARGEPEADAPASSSPTTGISLASCHRLRRRATCRRDGCEFDDGCATSGADPTPGLPRRQGDTCRC